MRICTFNRWLVAASLVMSHWTISFGQGDFQNLDFESAEGGSLPSEFAFMSVPVTNALPGWTAYFGSSLQPLVSYNVGTLGSVGIALLGPGSAAPGFQKVIIEGQFSVLLIGGINVVGQRDAIIAQTGTIPAGSMSLRMQVTGGPSLQATFGGQELQLQDLSSVQLPSGFTLRTVGADVSSFAGQTGELRFIAPYILGPNQVYLDSISFSPQAVPEPDVFGLFCFGALLLGWRWRCSRK